MEKRQGKDTFTEMNMLKTRDQSVELSLTWKNRDDRKRTGKLSVVPAVEHSPEKLTTGFDCHKDQRGRTLRRSLSSSEGSSESTSSGRWPSEPWSD